MKENEERKKKKKKDNKNKNNNNKNKKLEFFICNFLEKYTLGVYFILE